jgi:choline dehydrogenase-like flavoprotein
VNRLRYDVVIIGSGAGGGTVAARLGELARAGKRVLVLERGPRFLDSDFTGREIEMASALYADGGGFLTADGSMTLAFARGYGGSTIVYTGTSIVAPARVIERWGVPGLDHDDLVTRSAKYVAENNVHQLAPEWINENNRLFVEGARAAGYHAEQFPLNLRGCRGSSLCNLGCPNAAKQGTNRVQLPRAEREGVEVVTRAEVLRIAERQLSVRVTGRPAGGKGTEPEWAPGEYLIDAGLVVVAAGAIGTPSLLLRSRLPGLPRPVGQGFTAHPALILVAEHPRPIVNDVGHPKSFFIDRAETEGFVLETCMYFPFVTAKNLTGFGADHEAIMRSFDRLQMILVLACDRTDRSNRVTVDGRGEPVVRYRFTDRVVESLAAATRAAARIFFGAGAVRVHAPLANPQLIERHDADRVDQLIAARSFLPGTVSISSAHLMGGARMGSSATESVTDGWGRVHGMDWLRVADASLFPDALEINPYLTVMAVADRVADRVLSDVGQLS